MENKKIEIKKYIDIFLKKEKNNKHRYKSWCFVRDFFLGLYNKSNVSHEDKKLLALHLGMYLASWGMYRGSSLLLREFNYEIHLNAIEVLLDKKYKALLDIKDFDTLKKNGDLIGELYFKLHQSYASQFNLSNFKTKPTTTLMGKIILGTYACLPAYDRFIKEGLKIDGKEKSNIQIKRNFNTKDIIKCKEDIKKSINGICDTYSKEESQFKALRHLNIPIMKLLDMYLFEWGLEKYNNSKNK